MSIHERQGEVDLTTCDREAIHLLGTIQPFGALLALNSDFIVAQASANAQAILGTADPVEAGMRLVEIFDAAAVERLRAVGDTLDEGDELERIFGIDLLGDGARFDCAVHRSGAALVLEVEPHDSQIHADSVAAIRPLVRSLEDETRIKELCEGGARQLRRLLGFDRVMVYRFHDDGSGEVIAEDRGAEVDGFLGLRYPRSDIPAQARELYLRNRFRIIGDVAGKPVPIEPAVSLNGEPLDLSLSTLRAVSPVHIEYLKNMGVRASLSISIIIRGKLWGLFACHHYSPRNVPFSLRTGTELFSQMFSLLLDRVIHEERTGRRDLGRRLHDRLMSRLAGGASLFENLAEVGKIIGDVIPHDGASVFVDEQYVARGQAPTEGEFRKLVPALNAGETGRIFATESIAERIPSAADFARRAVGALVIPVSRRPRDYFVLWRKELKQTVTWAGNPEKPVEPGPDGDRLTPRKSFHAWQQAVDGRSAPWRPDELEIAESLRVTLLEVILRLTDDAMQDRKRAQEQQELLIAELNHRVRNILNLIRGLVNQTRHEAGDAASLAQLLGGRIGALAAAHENVTKENWAPASLKALIENEAEAYAGQAGHRVRVEGRDRLVNPNAYTVLALVIHEMMTNSAKYGALSDTGTVIVELEEDRQGDLEITWRERGGPPVQAPTRRGFGTTIIERSIPYELNGEAQVDYALQGLRARFVVPAKFVSLAKDEDSRATTARDRPQPATGTTRAPARVLVVEDNMIIALDAEEILLDLGADAVTMASSVAQAMKAMDEDTPEFVLLDYNLGQESSDPVARELKSRGIPFALATGYGDMDNAFADLGARAVVKKPYGKDEIAALFRVED